MAVCNEQIVINGVAGECSFSGNDVKQMYDILVAYFHRSEANGLMAIDSYDRAELKELLKLPDDYK